MAAKPAWPTIRQGNKGINVYAVQCLLVYHGASITIDGNFGSGTTNAVISYQQSHNLSDDGMAGPSTLASMLVYVSSGTCNNAAMAAQYLMNKFEPVSVDGAFGNGSKTATEEFQRKMGIAVTGTLNATTWQYLFGYNMYQGTSNVYASVCEYVSTLTSTQMSTNAAYICNYLMCQGFTKNAACGVLGNMQMESGVNPAIWEKFNISTGKGYGLVQWTPATKYIESSQATTVLSSATPYGANELALTNPLALMNSQLDFLLWDCASGNSYFYPTTPQKDHTGIRLTFSSFKASTLDAETLALVFHDHYVRSSDATEKLNQRAQYAGNWYSSL